MILIEAKSFSSTFLNRPSFKREFLLISLSLWIREVLSKPIQFRPQLNMHNTKVASFTYSSYQETHQFFYSLILSIFHNSNI